MNDNQLDAILRALAGEMYVPSERLVMRTKAALRGRRFLQVVIFSSIFTQLIAVGIIVFLLAAPGVPFAARVCGAVALFGYVGCIIVVAVAAQSTVVRFFAKLERLMA